MFCKYEKKIYRQPADSLNNFICVIMWYLFIKGCFSNILHSCIQTGIGHAINIYIIYS